MATRNRRIVLAARPRGAVLESDLRLEELPLPQPKDGEVLVRNLFLSLDPYMRGRMNDAKSYAPRVELDEVMVGETVGEVVESKNPKWKVGEVIAARLGWQEYGITDGTGARRIDPGVAPISTALGVLGMPGVTAFVGLLDIGKPVAGETVVVAAAAGAVGSVVGQLARAAGCRTVGIAGGAAKCEHVVKELGFDACLDHRSGKLADELRGVTPRGIDVYFENVGGEVFEAVMTRLNPFARIPLCGLVSQYSAATPQGPRSLMPLLASRVKLQGFIVSDHLERWPVALKHLGEQFMAGTLKHRETLAPGLESAPRAFIGMLKGENLGKQLVKLT